jgi:hypothetical protein
MWNRIGETQLRMGEIMEIYMVKTPDSNYEQDIMSFLSPTNRLWRWHLDLAIHGALDELEPRFYLGLVKGRIVSNVSTWEYGSIGLVAHLLTAKEHRRTGACTASMKAQIQDFRHRSGKVLIGGFKPTSYTIAKSLGFSSIIDNSEVMHYNLDLHFKKEYFEARKVSCRDSMWKDWPGVSLLFGTQEGCCIRSMKHRIFEPFDYEDYFLGDMWERLNGLCISKVLVSEEGSVVGYATLTSKYHVKSEFWLLDFFIHPNAASCAGTMLDAMDFPPTKTRCYVESGCPEKREMLLRSGFKERTLQEQITQNGKTLDIAVMEF